MTTGKVATAVLLLAASTLGNPPTVHFGLWQLDFHTGITRSVDGRMGPSQHVWKVCLNATSYKGDLDLETIPTSANSNCVRSHEKWKGGKYTASVDCKVYTGYDHTDVWVTVHDAEHVSIAESSEGQGDGLSSSMNEEAKFLSADCGTKGPP